MTLKPQSQLALDLTRAGADPIFFVEKIMGVSLNPAQLRWFRQLIPLDGWRWNRKFLIHVAANQIGKSLALALFIIWACTYKVGVNPADKKAWFERSYIWFHVAPTQQLAYHVSNDISQLVSGSHAAQVRGAEKGLKFQFPAGIVTATKVAQYYNGFSFFSGAEAQFRTTDDKASALQGYRAAGISFDEAAFEDHLSSIINETLMMRLVSTGGPLLLVSTPNGMNDYYHEVDRIQHGPGARMPEDLVWESDEGAVVWSTISDNVGYGLSQAEVDRMEINLDPATKEQQLRGAFLNPPEAFFTPVDAILRSFPTGSQELPKEVGPIPGHRYVAFWDPSAKTDATAVVVLDVTDKPWRGVYFRHWKKPMEITELVGEISKTHLLYNSASNGMGQRSSCICAFDSTSLGGVIINQLLQSIAPKRPLNFGGPDKKLKILLNARAALSRQDVLLPRSWTQLFNEVMNYKLADQKLDTDACMAFVGAVFCGEGVGDGNPSRQFNPHGRVTPRTIWR